MSKYPPLYTLIAFEAVARNESFSKAAEELNLSQSSVSRQIFILENSLQRKLFDRSKKKIQLTSIGESYLKEITHVLESIKCATSKITKSRHTQSLIIATSRSIAGFWLIPRLAKLKERFPQIKLRLLIVETIYELKNYEFDVAIHYHATEPIEYEYTMLFRETAFAVCAPDYLKKLCADPKELLNYPLIELDARPRNWTSWEEWFALQGIPFKTDNINISVDSYPTIIDFAANGFGICLAWYGLIDQHLKNGTLKKACLKEVEMPGAFYLIQHQDRSYSSVVREIFNLLKQMNV